MHQWQPFREIISIKILYFIRYMIFNFIRNCICRLLPKLINKRQMINSNQEIERNFNKINDILYSLEENNH